VRGYVLTGAVAAGAAAALVLLFTSGTREVVLRRGGPPAITTQPVVLERQPPQVEELEVHGADGSVLTIPGDQDEGATAVIWLSKDDDNMEGPI
jgi:hypothetical protein